MSADAKIWPQQPTEWTGHADGISNLFDAPLPEMMSQLPHIKYWYPRFDSVSRFYLAGYMTPRDMGGS